MDTVQEKDFAILDQHFSDTFTVKPVPSERWYLRGLHRTFIMKESKFCFSVFYNIDNRPTPSFARLPKKGGGHAGWIYLTHAQVIVYAVPAIQTAYMVQGFNLKHAVSEWSNTEYNKAEAYEIPFPQFADISYKQELVQWAQTPTD